MIDLYQDYEVPFDIIGQPETKICVVTGEETLNSGREMISSRMCLASNVSTNQLRFQLDHLHKEASETAAKANNARLRLLRLSEAAEKLRKQAAKSLRVGNDNEARDLLLQKKKILQAMEKSKSRAHLLDELAVKLNEAISVKETHLIGKVASDLELRREDLSSTIHVVSPLQDTAEIMDGDDKSRQNKVAVYVETDSQLDCDIEAETSADDLVASNNRSPWIESEIPSSLDGISSYNQFLDRLDSQLSNIETDLTSYAKLISMVLEEKEMSSNVKLQQVKEILCKILDTRQSIQKFVRNG